MKVYKFLSAHHAKSALNNKELKISTFESLNDPFELSAINLRNHRIKAFNQSAKNYIGNRYGLISFSMDYRSPLMWGHYSKSHSGICLGFEVSDELLHKVKYRKNRLIFDGKSKFNRQDLINLISVKFTEWKYEKEVRILTPLKDAREENGFYFEKFSESMRVIEVLLGVRSTELASDFEEIIRSKYQQSEPIRVRKLSLAKTKFGVTKTVHKR